MVVSHIICLSLPCFCVLTMGKNVCSKQRWKSVEESSNTNRGKEMNGSRMPSKYLFLMEGSVKVAKL